MKRARVIALLALLLPASAALASWYDDYDAGIAAARKGQWTVVVQKMTSAINGNGKENNSTRTYGAIFINYHPYYYRGLANMNLGKYEQAISDFEKTQGPGEYDAGSLDTLMQRAKSKLEAAQAPTPEPPPPTPVPVQPRPTPPAPTPVPVAPSAPVIDPGLRQRASAAIGEANSHLKAAQQRKASSSPQYTAAVNALIAANNSLGAAKSNDDLNNVITQAQNVGLMADAAVAPGVPAPPAPVLAQTRPTAAVEAVLGPTKERMRKALESYFAGEFDDAARAFTTLTRDLPNNGWVWAFLGASQYSQYAFEADEAYKSAAMQSFSKAKRLGRWGSKGLPEKYFSKRIRKVFENAG
jgi:tetratricopeptide (TPR) repeat protein